VAQLVLAWQHGDHLVQQFEVVIGVVGTGISRAEDRTEWLAGRVAPSSEGVKAKTALVLCTWQIRSGERPACRRTQ